MDSVLKSLRMFSRKLTRCFIKWLFRCVELKKNMSPKLFLGRNWSCLDHFSHQCTRSKGSYWDINLSEAKLKINTNKTWAQSMLNWLKQQRKSIHWLFSNTRVTRFQSVLREFAPSSCHFIECSNLAWKWICIIVIINNAIQTEWRYD